MFSRPSIASVDGMQHLSEVEWVISDYGVHEVGITICGVQYVLGVYGPEIKSFRHFSDNENPTRTLNSNAACHQLTLLTGRKQFTHAY